MGLLKGKFSLVKFSLKNDDFRKNDIDNVFLSKIANFKYDKSLAFDTTNSFTSIVQLGNRNKSINDQEKYLYWLEPFLFFTIREDVKRVSSQLSKEELNIEKQKWFDNPANEIIYDKKSNRIIPKDVLLAIKDSIKENLHKKALPTQRFVDVLIDTEKEVLYVFSTNDKTIDLVIELLLKIFPNSKIQRETFVNILSDKLSEEVFSSYVNRFPEIAISNDTYTTLKNDSPLVSEFLYYVFEKTYKFVFEDFDEPKILLGDYIVVENQLDSQSAEKITIKGNINNFIKIYNMINENKVIKQAVCLIDENELNIIVDKWAFSKCKLQKTDINYIDDWNGYLYERFDKIEKLILNFVESLIV